MDENKKLLIIHYLTEFILFFISIGILIILLTLKDFKFSWNLIPQWVFLFNGVLFTFWLWKYKSQTWEKAIAGIYFVLVQIIIASNAF